MARNRRTLSCFLSLTCCILFFFLSSCGQRVKDYYDENGKLTRRLIFIDKDSICEKNFYKNGQIKEEGIWVDSIRVGIWQEWYSDGREKWKGKYFDNERVIETYRQKPIIEFKGNPDQLFVDSLYQCRILIKGLHPDDISLIGSNHVSFIINASGSEFEFAIKFNREGHTKIDVYAVYFGEDNYIGSVDFVLD